MYLLYFHLFGGEGEVEEKVKRCFVGVWKGRELQMVRGWCGVRKERFKARWGWQWISV